ncbi:MAG TPA: protein kinase [Vicinamibacterales bacterium]|nr:protein kinase [Vicinamibacterales bacterium]
MTDKHDALERAVRAISSGAPLDSSSGTGLNAHDRVVLDQLRVIAVVAGVPDSTGAARAVLDQPLADRFEVREFIGEGSFGRVYRAWDRRLEREVALKVIPTAGISATALSEARRLARVHHPAIVGVYDVYQDVDQAVIVMELLRGRTLGALVEQHGSFPPARAAAIVRDICSALAVLHAAGIVHGDVKPQNVIVCDDGRVVLTDMSAATEPALRQRALFGTPMYLAPEVRAGGPAGPQADVFSAGVVLFHLLAGDCRRSVESSEVNPPLRTVIERTVVPLDRRYASATELADALQRIAGGTGGIRGRLALTIFAALIGTMMFATLRSGFGEPAALIRRGSLATARQFHLPPDLALFGVPGPSGTLLPYVNASGGLNLLDTRSNSNRTLVPATASESATLARMSPDERQIVYAWSRTDCDCEDLRVMSITTGASRVLLHDPAIEGVEPLEWRRVGGPLLVRADRRDGTHSLMFVSSDHGASTIVTTLPKPPAHATATLDGRFVVYDQPVERDEMRSDLYVYDVSQHLSSPLVTGPDAELDPFFRADDREVVFVSDRSGGVGLWTVPFASGHASGEPQVFRKDLGRFWMLDLNAADSITYWLENGSIDVYTARFDRARGAVIGAPTRTTDRYAGSNAYEAWSPDGRQLAYVSDRKSFGPARRMLVIHDVQSGRERDVPTGLSGTLEPVWADDGRSLIVWGPDSYGRTGLRGVDANSGRTLWFAPTRGGRSRAVLHGSGAIAFVDESGIRLLKPGGTSTTAIPLAGGWEPFQIAASHDGRWLAVAARRGESEAAILKVPVVGGPPEVLISRAGHPGFNVWDWTPDDSRLLYTAWTPDHREAELFAWSFDARSSSGPLLRDHGLQSVRLSPDGLTLAFVYGAENRELWSLIY